MIKADWDRFKAKFSENPQSNFEWFCYLLFCEEFDRPKGIFRYKNQSAIETEPIIKDKDVIGWQAKFYETKLSEHYKEFLNTIQRSKNIYPNLTKIIFYTNQEWGQGKKNQTPQGKKRVEDKANELEIQIEWRTKSFFESSFVAIKNNIISQHFFTLDKSIIDLVNEKKEHTKAILDQIQTAINFKEQNIEIDRSQILQKLEEELNKKNVLILSGIAGVGKTAVVKRLHQKNKDNVCLYVFKASEFGLDDVNQLFTRYSLKDFINAHENEEGHKVIVIDSAEKLLDIANPDPFKKFLSTILQENWKIIFTTRDNYLEDLQFQFIEIYDITPYQLSLKNLTSEELLKESKLHSFILPENEKLLELITNPFYLNQYLKSYTDGKNINYSTFKNKIWNQTIKKSEPLREQCFLQICFQRANEGKFFIYSMDDCNSQALSKLVQDGVLGHETAGYFITHDIYEEWALEKLIQAKFDNKSSNYQFITEIGESLQVRRSFRHWVSEQLEVDKNSIKSFIEQLIGDDKIKIFWKDEILISVLLSNYSETFFELFQKQLLEDNCNLLKRIVLLLRIACKEVDNSIFESLGIKTQNSFSMEYVFTQPKGDGWQSLIKFIYENLDKIDIANISFVFPLIYEWNNKCKNGQTTKLAGLIAIQYYKHTLENNGYLSSNVADQLISIILLSAGETKKELGDIFELVLQNKWVKPNDPYHKLSIRILTNISDAINFAKTLPDHTLKLAELLWCSDSVPKEDIHNPFSINYRSRLDIEYHFGLETTYSNYSPASALQTPIYLLLRDYPEKTISFILSFVNRAVQKFATSGFDSSIIEVEVCINQKVRKKQFASLGLWNMYRGTSSPVTPYLVQSIHMALEKYLLEIAKDLPTNKVEKILVNLLEESSSSSISAVVASVVLAFPDKCFNVATILLQTKEFFLYDTDRLLKESEAKMLYSMGYGLREEDRIYQDERIKTCEDKHREQSLENSILIYQIFKSEIVSDKEAEKRQTTIWGILDKYYKELPEASKEEKSDKVWRLYLARMDRRKMKPTLKEEDEGFSIFFNPEIEPKLEEFRKEKLNKSSATLKYTKLKMWAVYKLSHDDKHKEYIEYENNPKLAMKEVKKIVSILKKRKDEDFYLLNYSVPTKVCSILIRDYFDKLSEKEKDFCQEIILNSIKSLFMPNYIYQVSDGIESAISVLPILLQKFTKTQSEIKCLLLFILFNDHFMSVGHNHNNKLMIKTIHQLWKDRFDDANSFLYGYLLLKPKYEQLTRKISQENLAKDIQGIHEREVIQRFIKENEMDLEIFTNNTISSNSLNNIEKIELFILKVGFQLIPLKTTNEEHKLIAQSIILTFAKKMLTAEEDKIDYNIRHSFLESFADFILNSPSKDINKYLKPFIDNFTKSEIIAKLFDAFVLAEDKLNTYDNFWNVWNLFYDKIIEMCNDRNNSWNTGKIIKSYLFAGIPWKNEAVDWRTLKIKDEQFFRKITSNIRDQPAVLYSISKLLNDIGSKYLDEGISWLSKILSNNQNLLTEQLETNTIYYIEKYIRKYIYKHREKIKRENELKQKVLVLLNFLIEKHSTIGYLLRENIL